MQIGLFSNGQRTNPIAKETYDEDLREVILADELGLQEAWISEHGTLLGWQSPDQLPCADLFICKASIIKFGVQFLAKSKQLPKIKWSKIQEKVPINKFVVRGEVMGFRSLPWVCSQGYVIYTPWYNFIWPLCATTVGRLHSDSCSVRC